MKRNGLAALAILAATPTANAGAPTGTAFTYQGQLKDEGAPANGLFDFRFDLLAQDGGGLLARTCAFDVQVTNGLFMAEVDFGADAFDGLALLLQVAVKRDVAGEIEDCSPNTLDPFTPLGSPAAVTAAPYCVHALSAANGHALDAADGSPMNVLFVNNTGNVGIGTVAPAAKLHVNGAAQAMGLTSVGTTGTPVFEMASSGVLVLRDPVDQQERVSLSGAGPAGGVLSLTEDDGIVDTVTLSGGLSGGTLVLREGDGTRTVELDGQIAGGGASLLMDNSAGVQTVRLDADDTDAAVFVLTNAAGTSTVVLDGEAASPGGGPLRGGCCVRKDLPSAGTRPPRESRCAGGGRVSVRNNAGRETVEIDADEAGAAALRLSRASGGSTIALGAATSEIILRDAQGDTNLVLDGEATPRPGHRAGGFISVRAAGFSLRGSARAEALGSPASATARVLGVAVAAC